MRTVLVLLSLLVGASQVRAADEWWTYEKPSGVGISTGTINQAGQTLGQYCDFSESTCYWNLLLDTACDKDASAPALISDGTNSAAITTHCQGRVPGSSPPTYRYLLSDFSIVDKVVRGGVIVGIAFALDSGRFQVVRFNTSASAAKLDAMRDKASNKAKNTSGSSTL